jgi:hypothetical protein
MTRDYRIGEGGLLRRFEVAAHLTRLPRQLIALLTITWVPIVVLGVSIGGPEALVYDAAVHVRLLIAAPVFLILDQLFPPMCRYTLRQLHEQGFVPAAAEQRVDGLLRSAARLTDSSLPEVLLGLLGLGLGIAALLGMIPINDLTYRTGLTADQVWYAMTDLPIFQFLFWRSVWRWLVWVRFLVGLSRIKLALVPTHPDRAGGIRFLRLPSVGYCAVLLFAASSVVCAEWGSRFMLGETLSSFKPLLLVFGCVATLVAFGPLLLFAPQLLRARRQGMLELGSVATYAGRAFREVLLDPERSLASRSAQELASLEQTYRETVKQLSLFLFNKHDLALLLLAALLPMIPVIFLNVPSEDWQQVLSLVMGWGP